MGSRGLRPRVWVAPPHPRAATGRPCGQRNTVGPDAPSGYAWSEKRTQRSRKGKAYERREGEKRGSVKLIDTSGSGRRTQRPQVHALAEHIQDAFQTCVPGSDPQARGSLGTFHPWKVPRPGAKYPPSFSESRDHGTDKRQTSDGAPGRRALQQAALYGGPYWDGL